jgi:uncharacterized protein YoaH (UPF0181 family)
MTKKPKTVEFEEGWADELNLTQEEYDALVDGIRQLVATGEIFENATELPLEEQQEILEQINNKNTRH